MFAPQHDSGFDAVYDVYDVARGLGVFDERGSYFYLDDVLVAQGWANLVAELRDNATLRDTVISRIAGANVHV
jgi:hypothetical protein